MFRSRRTLSRKIYARRKIYAKCDRIRFGLPQHFGLLTEGLPVGSALRVVKPTEVLVVSGKLRFVVVDVGIGG